MQYCSIIAHESVEQYGKTFAATPVARAISTGNSGTRARLWCSKNGHYWEYDTTGKQLPFLDAVSISFYNNKATEFLEFRQGG